MLQPPTLSCENRECIPLKTSYGHTKIKIHKGRDLQTSPASTKYTQKAGRTHGLHLLVAPGQLFADYQPEMSEELSAEPWSSGDLQLSLGLCGELS